MDGRILTNSKVFLIEKWNISNFPNTFDYFASMDRGQMNLNRRLTFTDLTLRGSTECLPLAVTGDVIRAWWKISKHFP